MILSHKINVVYRTILLRLYTIVAKIKLKWWGISFGNNLKVFGKVYFRKLPKSKIQIGKNCLLYSKVNSNLIGVNRPCMISTLTKEALIKIGDNSGFSGTVIGAFKKVTIGDNVKCGANTLITDSDWHPEDSRSGEPKEVTIHNNVWLGEGVKVLKGVEIGENTLIGAGSVVVKSLPANVIAAGNPCKVLKKISVEN